MATVYLARQTDLEREVALKELALLGTDGTDDARRFLREARLAGSLGHPNIVTVHDYLERKGTPYIAMEYLPRGSLRPYLGRTSLAQAGGVLRGVLAGLAHAHGRAIVHRDVKPENIMVTGEGAVKVADFGIAKALDVTRTGVSLTVAGTTLGTPRYMSPERAMGREIGPWSDLYAVGAMAFELLAGQPPFAETTEPMAILMRQINDPIPPVRTLEPGVDEELSNWVGRLLEKDPADRTQAAATAADELEEILIAILGPRWQREAALPATPAARAPVARRAEATRGRTRPAPQPRAAAAAAAAVSTGADRTVAPRTVALRRRRRWRRAPVIVLLSLGLAGLALAAQGHRPGGAADPGSAGAGDPARELRTSETAHRSQIRSGASASSREQGALALARDYAAAARSARALPPTASNLQQVATLEQTARAYRDAADAARRDDGSDYDDAIARASAGAQALQTPTPDSSGVGDSRSDDPSDDEPDENDNGD